MVSGLKGLQMRDQESNFLIQTLCPGMGRNLLVIYSSLQDCLQLQISDSKDCEDEYVEQRVADKSLTFTE